MTEQQIIWIVVAAIIFGGMALSLIVLKLTLPAHNRERLINIENRNRERMALIEKGMDPALADKKNHASSSNDPLVWGLLLAGVGLGVFVGYIVSLNTHWSLGITTHSFPLIFGGIGLIIYYFHKRNDSKKAI